MMKLIEGKAELLYIANIHIATTQQGCYGRSMMIILQTIRSSAYICMVSAGTRAGTAGC